MLKEVVMKRTLTDVVIKRWLPMMLVATSILLLGACAANQARSQQDQAHLAAVHAAAGKPVGSFSLAVSTLYSWEPLSNQELLVYTRPRQAWLLNVGLCPQLPFTVAIGLTSHVGQVNTNRDSVLVRRGDFPCHIQSIRPVDVKQLRQQTKQRSGGKVVSESADQASPKTP